MAAPSSNFLSIINTYTNISEEECLTLYRNALARLESAVELSITDVSCLRKVKLITSYCNEYQSLPKDLLQMLIKIVSGSWPSHNPQQRKPSQGIHHAVIVLSGSILQDLLLSNTESSFTPTVEPKHQNIASLLAVVFAQGRENDRLGKLASQMVRWVSTLGFDYQVQCSALHYLVHTAKLYRDLLSEDQIFVVSSQLSDWLSNASIEQSQNPLLKQKNKKPELVTEIDGSDCDEFFTLLSLSQYYSPDQLMNIHTFSALRSWLEATFVCNLKSMEDVSKSSSLNDGNVSTDQSSKSAKRFSKRAKEALLDKACEYCLRVLDQCSRRPSKAYDVELLHACATEAIFTLDLLCSLDPTLIQKLFPAIKTFHSEVTEGTTNYPRAVLAALQFFINYGENVVFNAQVALEDFFEKVVGNLYKDPFFAFDVVTFLHDNLESLCYKTLILERFFPNLLKILAWNPRTFLGDFIDILPAMTSQNTAIELFHTLLDLPCTTAALEFQKRSELLSVNPVLTDIKPDWAKSVSLMHRPDNKPWFNFVLRTKGGQGDTINKLEILHVHLSSMVLHPRVLYTAESALVLLRVYFNTICEHADYDLITHLVPVIIERTSLIYGIQGYKQEVHNILGAELLKIFKRHPILVVDHQRELLDSMSTPKNMEDREHIFIQLVWIIGEYSSPSHDARCTTVFIQKYYETLEALFYESAMTLLASDSPIQSISLELIVTMMSTLAKLASQCQNLIPRVILCLTKVSQQMNKSSKVGAEEKTIIRGRSTEYVNLLKFPDIAGVILSPPQSVMSGHLHKDTNASSALLIRATARLVN